METEISMATTASHTPDPTDESTLENAVTRREGRAQTQAMDVALLRQGGIYEVCSASGSVYTVDLLDQTCTCPDDPPSGGCKHYRRVRTDVRAGLVPRPDGKLLDQPPTKSEDEITTETDTADGDQCSLSDEEIHAIRSAEAALIKQQLLTELLARELERTQLDQEIHDLEFLIDVLHEVRAKQGYADVDLSELESAETEA
jgi:hypothetical protein